MRYFISTIFALMVCCGAWAQNLAIKSNLVYDATATINLGLEIGLGERTTLDLSGNYNAWDLDKESNKKIRHALFQPEFRYYFCEKMNGHFLGIHGLATEFNVCRYNWLISTAREYSSVGDNYVKDSRYEGVGYGGGLAYGYNLMLSNRFNMEFTIGAGYIHFDYDRFNAPRCSLLLESSKCDYWGITKLGVSLMFIIK